MESPQHCLKTRCIAAACFGALCAGTALAIPPGDPGPADVRFTIDAEEEQHAISPYIYGMTFSAIRRSPIPCG